MLGLHSYLHNRGHIHYLIFQMMEEMQKCINMHWEYSDVMLTQR